MSLEDFRALDSRDLERLTAIADEVMPGMGVYVNAEGLDIDIRVGIRIGATRRVAEESIAQANDPRDVLAAEVRLAAQQVRSTVERIGLEAAAKLITDRIAP